MNEKQWTGTIAKPHKQQTLPKTKIMSMLLLEGYRLAHIAWVKYSQ